MIPNFIVIDWNTHLASVDIGMKKVIIRYTYNLVTEWENIAQAEQRMLNLLRSKWIVKLSLEEDRKKRNNAQNRLYWKWIWIISKETGNDDEWLHAMMKKKFLSKRKLVKLGGKRSYQNIEWSTTDLSVKEFSEFLNKVHLFFSELGFILPTMDDNELNSLYQYWLNEK